MMRKLNYAIIVGVLFFGTSVVFARTQTENIFQQTQAPLVLSNSQDEYALGEVVEIYVDESTTLSIEDITKNDSPVRFQPISSYIPSPEISAYWLRISISNQAKKNRTWLLIYKQYRMNEISVYQPNLDGIGFRTVHTGNTFPFSSRDYPHHYYIFNLDIPENKQETIYIRLMDSGASLAFSPLEIQSLEKFSQTANIEYFLAGAYYFIILTILLYNVFFMFSIRYRGAVSYIIFLFTVILNTLSSDGFGHQFIWSNLPLWAEGATITSVLLYLAALLNYALVILDTRNTFPRWAKLSTGIIIILLALGILRWVTGIFMPILLVALLVGFIMPIVIAVKTLKIHRRRASIFLSAFFVYLVLIIIIIFNDLTGNANLDGTNMIRIAFIWVLFVFTFVSNDRINTIRKEREEAQAKLVLEQKEALRTQIELTDVMEESRDNILTAYDTTLEGWAQLLELRDKETEGHSRKVTELTVLFSREIGIPEDELEHIRRGALLHDIGKIAIPDGILLKPGPLTDEEWIIMKQHPVFARKFLSGVPFLQKAMDIPVYHHEAWNGQGYPYQLIGEEIPLCARLFTIIDNWDALLSDRPYRKGWHSDKVIDYLTEKKGIIFDPALVPKFLILLEKL